MDTLASSVKGFEGFRAGIRASGHGIENPNLIGGTLDTDTLEVSWVSFKRGYTSPNMGYRCSYLWHMGYKVFTLLITPFIGTHEPSK